VKTKARLQIRRHHSELPASKTEDLVCSVADLVVTFLTSQGSEGECIPRSLTGPRHNHAKETRKE
jgi:hypothetical protein